MVIQGGNVFKPLKIIGTAVCISFGLSFFSGCSENDGSNGIFKYDISDNPQTLDPQSADDINSELIISNLYIGLLKTNADGSLGEGAASDYTVSEDGLTYRFKLRQDVWWTDQNGFEAQCTAKDFVFGFQRLFLPETRAPRADEYFCVKNSENIFNGNITDMSQLGVKAVGDFELEFKLDYPDPNFPMLLTQTPAMPCCEEYFIAAQGKYGLTAKATPSNGPFYLKKWEYDPYTITDNNYLALRRNTKYSETRKVYPSILNFFIEDEERFVSDFTSGTTSCIAVTDEQAKELSKDYSYDYYSNITVGIVFNNSDQLFSSGGGDFRCALASLANKEHLGGALEHYKPANAVVPEEVSLLDVSYREYAGESICLPYNPEKAREYYSNVKNYLDTSQFVGARILVPDDSAAETVSYIMQEWQREFGFYCVIDQPDKQEYYTRLKNGDFEVAVVELTGGYNSPEAYLRSFLRGDSLNYSGFGDMEFLSLMDKAGKASELSESAELYARAEKLLLKKGAFIPLYYKNEYFFTADGCMDIIYNPFTKVVDFSEAKTD